MSQAEAKDIRISSPERLADLALPLVFNFNSSNWRYIPPEKGNCCNNNHFEEVVLVSVQVEFGVPRLLLTTGI